MNGPSKHSKNDVRGIVRGGCGHLIQAMAARPYRRAPMVLAALSLLLVLGLDQYSPGAGVPAAAAASAAEESTTAGRMVAVESEDAERTLLTPEGEIGVRGGRFGASVAISGDGSTALIGAPYEDGGPEQNEGPGSAWVFTRSNGKWTQPEELAMPQIEREPGACGNETLEDGAEGEASHVCRYGISVALSQNGDTAVIGAPHARGNSGAVYIFTRSTPNVKFALADTLADPSVSVEGPGHRFGSAVAISADGTTVLVGASLYAHRAFVFTGSGSNWANTAELVDPAKDEAGSEGEGMFGAGREHEGEGSGLYGQSVALSADGRTALIGAPGYPGHKGGAWIFRDFGEGEEPTHTRLEAARLAERPGETEAQRLAREEELETGARFGASVALSGDGDTAIVGARGYQGDRGAAWIFSDSRGSWSEEAELTGQYATKAEEEEGKEEELGSSVALSYDGYTALVGAPYSNGHAGVARLFSSVSGLSWGEQTQLQAGSNFEKHPQVRFGSGVALAFDADTRLVGGRATEHRGAAWVFGPNPSVAAISPNKGPTSGGTTVTITGEHLASAQAVRFGATEAASFSVVSEKSIIAVSPPGTGTVPVSVETSVARDERNPPYDRFTYVTGPGEGGGGGGSGQGESGKEESGTPTSQSGSTGATAKGGVLPFGPVSGGACGASLLNKKISVLGHHRAVIELRGTGAGACSGVLTLRVKVKSAKAHGKKPKTGMVVIGTARFSLAAGRTRAVSVALNAAGRRFLRAGRGHLNASLTILKSTPLPAQARSASVRLTQRTPRIARTKKT